MLIYLGRFPLEMVEIEIFPLLSAEPPEKHPVALPVEYRGSGSISDGAGLMTPISTLDRLLFVLPPVVLQGRCAIRALRRLSASDGQNGTRFAVSAAERPAQAADDAALEKGQTAGADLEEALTSGPGVILAEAGALGVVGVSSCGFFGPGPALHFGGEPQVRGEWRCVGGLAQLTVRNRGGLALSRFDRRGLFSVGSLCFCVCARIFVGNSRRATWCERRRRWLLT